MLKTPLCCRLYPQRTTLPGISDRPLYQQKAEFQRFIFHFKISHDLVKHVKNSSKLSGLLNSKCWKHPYVAVYTLKGQRSRASLTDPYINKKQSFKGSFFISRSHMISSSMSKIHRNCRDCSTLSVENTPMLPLIPSKNNAPGHLWQTPISTKSSVSKVHFSSQDLTWSRQACQKFIEIVGTAQL